VPAWPAPERELTDLILPDDPAFGDDVQLDYPGYRSTALRAPRVLVPLPESFHTVGGPVFGEDDVDEHDADLTKAGDEEPLGERIVVTGRLLGDDGRPIQNALIEVWQANAAGRYAHEVDQHAAPLDPNFLGAGRCLTGADGSYRFVTIKPGSYPWGNHENAWRPAHIHFSILGRSFTERLVTQMYFPGDPLLAYDPIFHAVRNPTARERLIATFDPEATVPSWALAYRWDIVLRRTPTEQGP
jgi:protocatechuate 3,4-dioxygenase, beta subunit